MKKIEPVVWPVAWIDDGGMLFCNDGIIPDGTDLYTDDALQAVAEAVRDACEEYGYDCGFVDLAAIINQLKGK